MVRTPSPNILLSHVMIDHFYKNILLVKNYINVKNSTNTIDHNFKTTIAKKYRQAAAGNDSASLKFVLRVTWGWREQVSTLI